MLEKLQAKAETIIPYTVSGGLISSPVWLAALTSWLQFIAVLVGIAVGLTTIHLNRLKIKKEKQD